MTIIKKIFNHPYIEIPDDENYKVLKDKATDSYMKNNHLVDKSRIKLTTLRMFQPKIKIKNKKIKG